MDIILQTYYILLPIIATALVGWVGAMIKGQKKLEQERIEAEQEREKRAQKANEASGAGIMLVLRYMLKRYHSEYMLQGKITYSQYQDWMDIYAAYSALGGNSIAVDWNDEIETLERTDSIPSASPFEAMLKHSYDKKGGDGDGNEA